MKKEITAKHTAPALGPYSLAMDIHGFVYASGQIGILEDGQLLETIEQQTTQALKNIEAILLGAQLEMSHIVKTTVFLSNMNTFEQMNKVYQTFFDKPYPARTTVEVSKLPKDALVEIEVIAYKKTE